jgi:hypothetical protein
LILLPLEARAIFRLAILSKGVTFFGRGYQPSKFPRHSIGASIMVAELVISANFSDASSRILAGSSEDNLAETSLVVSDVRSLPINAVKALGGKFKTALVISRVNDSRKGWSCTRKFYRRVPTDS